MEIPLKKRRYSKEVIESDLKKVVVAGWVQEIRRIGKLIFILLRDREGTIQITIPKNKVPEDVFEKCGDLTKESVISVFGKVVVNKEAPHGKEIIPEKLEVLSKAQSPIPLEFLKIESSLDKRLDYRFLDLRNPKNLKIFKFQSELENLFRKFFLKKGFIETHTSKIVSSATEGGANVFQVNYFEKKAFLAQSPQLYKQMLVIGGFEKVFEIAPVYRAEPHHTTRHLCEYISIDFEVGFIDDVEDVMKIVESVFAYVIRNLKDLPQKIYLPSKIPRISYSDAYKILRKLGRKVVVGSEIGHENEKVLADFVKEKYNSDFYFLTEFPWEERPFYTMRLEKDNRFTKGFDLIFKGLEVVTGSQREHRYEKLVEQCKEKGLNLENFDFYLNFFKYGAPPHGGAAIGLERVTMQMLNLKNIREASILPRDPERLVP